MVPVTQWVGQQGAEVLGMGSNPCIYHYFLLSQFDFDFRGLFLYSYQNCHFPPNFIRCFMNKKADFCRFFVFFPLEIFSRSQRTFHFLPELFSRHIVLKHKSAVYAKPIQVPALTKNPFHEKLRW